MPRFLVEVREQHCATYYVDADSSEQARNKVQSGAVEISGVEFVETMDEPEDYFVTEVDAEGNAIESNTDTLIIVQEG